MIVALDSKELVYSGRIDMTNPEEPELIFPASSLNFRFHGKKAVLFVKNRKACWDNYLGAIVDGVQKCWKLNDSGVTEVVLLEEEDDREHEVLVFKRQDSCHEMVLHKLLLSTGSRLLKALPKPERRMEVYGDSVSAGEVSEAVEYVGKEDPEHNGEYSNSWYSYAWIAARKLNAQLHDIAQGGIPLLNGTGWVEPPVYPGMEYMWDKVHYHPQFGNVSLWDFSKYTPHLVIVAIGQNDSHPDDYMKDNPDGERASYWKYKYRKLVENIRGKYPKALIVLTTTILEHDKNWDRAIEEVCQSLRDGRVRHFMYSQNGSGTPGHIRVPEAERMAEELTSYINNLDIPVWEV